ncbi:MAG: NUDIX domain-containing protein [Alphaproteobacteria bacterium]|nr:MAG: hypothetical protein B6I23_01650 [Rickettsiaceae bacterium 4572_127]
MILDVILEKKENVYDGYNPIDDCFFRLKFTNKNNSNTFSREVIRRKDAVGILLHNKKNDSLIFVRQFRAGNFVKELKKTSLEIPIGLIKKTDNLKEIAIKETKEETGLDIKSLEKINSFYPEISSSSRQIHLFYSQINTEEIPTKAGLESEDEFIFVEEISIKESKEMLLNGDFDSSHTSIALSWFFLNNKDKK